MPRLPGIPSLPLRPIAAALAAALTLAPIDALATKIVSNCNDAGAGSLRQAILDAADGELVDATGLVCSRISVTGQFLTVANNSLTIDGPGADKLTIDVADNPKRYPVFLHNGSGTLEIDHVTISAGDKYLNDNTLSIGGGCIDSTGSVKLVQSVVSNCTMTAGPQSHAKGGAIYASGDVTLVESTVTGSSAHGASPFGYEMTTYGGAIYAKGKIKLDHSVVSDNHALSGGGIYSRGRTDVYSSSVSGNDAFLGGGLQCHCELHVAYSTFANNHAQLSGALYVGLPGTPPATALFIRNSTITGNVIDATFSAAAMETAVPITISNSTIAFNIAPNHSSTGEGALYSFADTLTLQSTIVSDNYPFDVDVQGGTTAISGAKNLVPHPSAAAAAALPAGTLSACPLLQPLAWNGGPTRTLALRAASPAIGAGNNLIPLFFDQRGSGFPRVHGVNPDIGAFEWQGGLVDDDIFSSAFELGLCQT